MRECFFSILFSSHCRGSNPTVPYPSPFSKPAGQSLPLLNLYDLEKHQFHRFQQSTQATFYQEVHQIRNFKPILNIVLGRTDTIESDEPEPEVVENLNKPLDVTLLKTRAFVMNTR